MGETGELNNLLKVGDRLMAIINSKPSTNLGDLGDAVALNGCGGSQNDVLVNHSETTTIQKKKTVRKIPIKAVNIRLICSGASMFQRRTPY